MLGSTDDSLLAALGRVAATASTVFWWCAACVETLLDVVDVVWRIATAAVTLVCVILEYLLAVATALKEFVVDVGLLAAGLVKFVASLVVAAFGCAQAIARAVELAVCAMYHALAASVEFAVSAVDAPRVVLHEAVESAADVDVRAFESTFWLIEKLAETLFAAASWLMRSTVALLASVTALPWNTLVWIESFLELIAVSAASALRGACRAVAAHASAALSWSVSGVAGLQKAAYSWSMADDWPSRLIACLAVLLLISLAVAKRLQMARDQSPDGQGMPERNTEGSRNDSDHAATSSGGSSASSVHTPGPGSDATRRDGFSGTNEERRGSSPLPHLQRQAAGDASAGAARCDGDGLGAYLSRLQEQLEAEKEKQLCVVCQHKLKSVVLLPCRHLCVCTECSRQLTNSRLLRERVCPLCRCTIGSTVPVYT